MDTIEFIIKTNELVRKLSEAEESTNGEREIIEKRIVVMCNRMKGDKHQSQVNTIENIRNEICRMKQFPDHSYYAGSIKGIQPPNIKKVGCSIKAPIPYLDNDSINVRELKEVADSIKRSRSRFQHLSNNLATERKMAKELQQLETQWKEQPEVNLVEDKRNLYYRGVRFRGLIPLPNKPLHNLIELWADEAEHVGRLVLRDSKNMKETRQTLQKLSQLIQTGNQMYWQLNVGKAEFKKHWDSRKMRSIQNSIHRIEFDLVKASRCHAEGCAKSERYREEVVKLRNMSSELNNELRRLQQEKSLATFDLLKLQEKQASPIL